MLTKLPNAEAARVDEGKLRDYCLNPFHLKGKHKAKVFAKALGLTQEHAGELKTLILQEVENATCVESGFDLYGRRFEVNLTLVYKGKSAWVRTGWIVKHEEDFPRLTTCYVLA